MQAHGNRLSTLDTFAAQPSLADLRLATDIVPLFLPGRIPTAARPDDVLGNMIKNAKPDDNVYGATDVQETDNQCRRPLVTLYCKLTPVHQIT